MRTQIDIVGQIFVMIYCDEAQDVLILKNVCQNPNSYSCSSQIMQFLQYFFNTSGRYKVRFFRII